MKLARHRLYYTEINYTNFFKRYRERDIGMRYDQIDELMRDM